MRKRFTTGLTAALLTLAGGAYLSAATPLTAQGNGCYTQAVATYNFVQENICGGYTDCSFECSADNSRVQSFSCTCGG